MYMRAVLQAGKVPVFTVLGSWRGHLVHLCLGEFVSLWEFPIRLRGVDVLHQFDHTFLTSDFTLLVFDFCIL